MALNINETAIQEDLGDRVRLTGELLDELTAWGLREVVGSFRAAHICGPLSLVHLNVLSVLETEGSLSMSRLAEALDVSVASATGIVGRMELRGLVERRHSTDDRRVVDVHLTEAGAAVFPRIGTERRKGLATILDQLTDAELAAFLRGIRAMRAAAQRYRLAAIDPSARVAGPSVPRAETGPRGAAQAAPPARGTAPAEAASAAGALVD